MTNNNQPSGKKQFLLSSIILCLMDEWTRGVNPIESLDSLGISKWEAIIVIADLVRRGYVKWEVSNFGKKIPVTKIIDEPCRFREAIVLTESGKIIRKENKFESLKKSWNMVGKEKDD